MNTYEVIINDLTLQVIELTKRVGALELELAETYEEAFLEIATLIDGWYCSNARNTAIYYGDKLVELGVYEKDSKRGHGRVQWYQRVAESAGEDAEPSSQGFLDN